MRREIFQEIEIPAGVEAKMEGKILSINGKRGENKKKFNTSKMKIEIRDKKIIIGNKIATKREKRLINTAVAHIKNMMRGVSEGFEYKLKIVFSHFPITVEIQGKEALIKNFLGEKIPRKMKILGGVEVKVNKEFITVSGSDRELAGQTAANFEKATAIPLRDRRIFQDGIFITNKAGKEI